MGGVIISKDLTDKTEEKIIKLLSFASKMGTLVYGKERLERHLQAARNKWIFLASDCSENTKKMWRNKSSSTGARLIQFQKITKKSLAQRLGKKELSAISTSNKDILKGIKKYLEND